MAKWDTPLRIGFSLISYLTVSVLCQSVAKTCYYTVLDPGNPNPNQGSKSCYNGCCYPNSIDPCCNKIEPNESLSAGAIGGIIIGVLIAIIIVGAVIFIFLRKSRMKEKEAANHYITPQNPVVSYIAPSEMSDTTDYRRDNRGYATSFSTQARSRDNSVSYLPPIAKHDDDSDLETASNKVSYKSEPFSTKSEPYKQRSQNYKSKGYAESVSSFDKQSVTSDFTSVSRNERSVDGPRDHSSDDGPRDHRSGDRPRDHRSGDGPRGRLPRERSPHNQNTRDRRPRDQSPRQSNSRSHHRPRVNSSSSMDSRENRPRHGHSKPHTRNNANSESSMNSRDHSKSISESVVSDQGSIGTTV
ncbi:uncharacterized protein LOC143066166 [Mytilus galloprovincialis]|uniref:uncharacterized protein LOC143066166 n=1 Tax=Mytilus galloprovincialis TaxID=29158 RepID=UPI003F7C5A58